MPSIVTQAVSRAAADTRSILLAAAAQEIHVHGFQAASISRILAKTGVTKGALYHHFPSKQALGYAVVDECYAPSMRTTWVEPLSRDAGDSLRILIDVIRKTGQQMTEDDVLRGCPLNNLAQEMSPVDEGFRRRIEGLLGEWRHAIEYALHQAQDAGRLAAHVDVRSAAAFIVASLEGCVGMAKNAQSKKTLLACGSGLIAYLESLGVPSGDNIGNTK